MEELEKLTDRDEVLEDMVVTMKQLSADEKIRMKCEAKEEYERRLATAKKAGMLEAKEEYERRLATARQYGIQQGINIERENTIRERERADAERKKRDDAEARILAMEEENRRLLKLISEK